MTLIGLPITESSDQCTGCNTSEVNIQRNAAMRLRMVFHKKSMTEDLIGLVFGRGIFEVPSPFEVPAEMLHPLGMQSFVILPGNYAFEENQEFIIVDF
jgi:hypothetical protein